MPSKYSKQLFFQPRTSMSNAPLIIINFEGILGDIINNVTTMKFTSQYILRNSNE